MTGCFLFLAVMAYWGISLYNQLVDLKHASAGGEILLQELKAENAEIKNNLYLLTDYKGLIKLGEEVGLAEVKSPKYFELNDSSWSVVSASQL